MIQMYIITIIKLIYVRKLFLHKPEVFEIRNLPLNKNAHHVAKFIICWRAGSSTAASGVGAIGFGAVIDQGLVSSGRAPVFIPTLGKLVISLIGPGQKDAVVEVSKIQSLLDNIKTVNDRALTIKEFTDKYNIESLMGYGFTKEEAYYLKGIYNELEKATMEERNNIANEILEKADKIKNDVNNMKK